MSRITTPKPPRPYRSDLRAQQAEETRARILDATLRVMARGIASVSIPAVAREAGVSIPTVYRHFGSKRDLLEALYPYAVRRSGTQTITAPRSIDDLREGVRALFERLDSADDLARAAMTSPAAEEARRLHMPGRMAQIRQLVATIEPKPSRADQERIARGLLVIVSSSALRAWRDHLGMSVDEAVDEVEWLVRAMIAAATKRKER